MPWPAKPGNNRIEFSFDDRSLIIVRPCSAFFVWLVLASVLSAQEQAALRKFDEPLNVSAEKSKIIGEFITAQTKVPIPEALAARDAALTQLAAAAEAAKSTDLALLHVYLMLNRHTDVLRAASVVLEKTPNDLVVRSYELQALVGLKRTDEAAAAFGKVMALDIPATDAPTYVRSVPYAAQAMIRYLADERKSAEADQALVAWTAQLDKLQIALEQGSTDTLGAKILSSAYSAVTSLKLELNQKKQLAKLPANPRPPNVNSATGKTPPMPAPMPQKTATAPAGLNPAIDVKKKAAELTGKVKRPTPSSNPSPSTPMPSNPSLSRPNLPIAPRPVPSGPRQFAQPLDISLELKKILADFNDVREWSARNNALGQLAKAAEAAKSADHIGLVRLYSELERFDDALQEVKSIPQSDATRYTALADCVTSLVIADRTDDAVAVYQKWLAVDVPLTDVEAYLQLAESSTAKLRAKFGSNSTTVKSLLIQLSEAGKADAAEEVIDATNEKLQQLLAKYDQGPVPPMLQRGKIINSVATVSSLHSDWKCGRLGSPLQKELKTLLEATPFEKHPEDSPEFNRLVAARIEGLVLLATKAEASNSTEDFGLSATYSALTIASRRAQRLDEEVVLLQKLIESNPAAWIARREHYTLLCELKRLEDALAAFRDWIAQDVPLEKSPRYIYHLIGVKKPIEALIPVLNETGRYADALAALEPMYAKLTGFIEEFDKSPPPEGTVSREYLLTWRSSTWGYRDAIADAEWKKLGTGTRPAAAIGASPLTKELANIAKQFDINVAFPRGTPRQGPKFDKFIADRKEAFVKLAASPLVAQSTDHSALAFLYSEVGRLDDAVKEAQALVKQYPSSGDCYAELLRYLTEAQRLDEALAAFQQWRVQEVQLVNVGSYIRPIKSDALKKMSIALRLVGRDEDADQVVSETRDKLQELLAIYDKGPAPLKLKRNTISNELSTVSNLASGSLDFWIRQAAQSTLRKKINAITLSFAQAGGRGTDTSEERGGRARPGGTGAASAEKGKPDRILALAALAAEPETARSTDLPTLIELYTQVDRTEDALAVFQRWIAQEVAPNEVRKFFWSFDAFVPFIKALARKQKPAVGWQATVDLEEKLDQVSAMLNARPPEAHSWTFATNETYSKVRNDMQGELAKAEREAYASGDQTVFSFSKPLRISTEHRRINEVFADLKDRQKVELAKLAEAAEAAKTKDHVALAAVYGDLERYQDAEEEIKTALSQNPEDVQAHAALIQLMFRAQRTEDAIAALRNLMARKVPLKGSDVYLLGVVDAGSTLASSLAAAGNTDAALQVYRELKAFKVPQPTSAPLSKVADTLILAMAERGEHDAALAMLQDRFQLIEGGGGFSFELTATKLVNLLASAGNYAEAEQVLETWESLLDKWAEGVRQAKGSPPPIYDSLKKTIGERRQALKQPAK